MAPRIVTPLERTEIEGVFAPLGSARSFPGRAFFDEDVFAFEQKAIFGASWVCVGRVEDVALPGQWFREDVGGEPIVVVRGPDLALRAFYDVCRHRGASLVGGESCGRSRAFRCPYHGWTYDLDGRLRLAPFAPAGLDLAERGLKPARVEAWRGFVFVDTDDGAASLAEGLGDPPPWLAGSTQLGSVRRGRRVVRETNANWKLCVQNFQESHHFSLVHRALEKLTPTREAESWLGGRAWLGGTMNIVDAETVSLEGSRNGRPLLVSGTGPPRVYDAIAFPSLFTSLQPDYLLTYRLTPLSAAKTRIVAETFFHPSAFVPGFDPRDVFDFWDRVDAEDQAICESQQKNVRSGAFVPACYATVEEGVQAFDRLVAAIHLDHLDPRS